MSHSEDNKLAVFQGKHIRKVFHEDEWWFSIIDVIEVLTASSIPKRYWSDLKRKLANEGYSELYEKIVQLKFASADGKLFFCEDGSKEKRCEYVFKLKTNAVQTFNARNMGKEKHKHTIFRSV